MRWGYKSPAQLAQIGTAQQSLSITLIPLGIRRRLGHLRAHCCSAPVPSLLASLPHFTGVSEKALPPKIAYPGILFQALLLRLKIVPKTGLKVGLLEKVAFMLKLEEWEKMTGWRAGNGDQTDWKHMTGACSEKTVGHLKHRAKGCSDIRKSSFQTGEKGGLQTLGQSGLSRLSFWPFAVWWYFHYPGTHGLDTQLLGPQSVGIFPFLWDSVINYDKQTDPEVCFFCICFILVFLHCLISLIWVVFLLVSNASTFC